MKEYRDQPKQMGKKVEKAKARAFKDGGDKFFEKKSDREGQELKHDDSPDLTEELFKEINPLGLPLGDIKKKMESEVERLENLIEELKKVSPILNKDLIDKSLGEIRADNWWIMKIDDFLMDNNVENLKKLKSNLN